jgi:hypothetical protein
VVFIVWSAIAGLDRLVTIVTVFGDGGPPPGILFAGIGAGAIAVLMAVRIPGGRRRDPRLG